MISYVRQHPAAVGAGALTVVAGLAWLAFGFFGVHTLFIDDIVDEAGPVFDAAVDPGTAGTAPFETEPSTSDTGTDAVPATTTTEAPDPTTTTSDAADPVESVRTEMPTSSGSELEPVVPEIVAEYIGAFRSDAHPTSGAATVLGNGTGQRFLRFENFETDNGPDLNVYLVNSSTGDVSDFIDLGDLSGNIGDQNYEIPADVDLDVYDEVVIWCVRFGVGFGDARLMAA